MKCPIRYNLWVDKDNNPILLDQDCLKEECAWWFPLFQGCVIKSFAGYLRDIALASEAVQEKMPHVEKFTK